MALCSWCATYVAKVTDDGVCLDCVEPFERRQREKRRKAPKRRAIVGDENDPAPLEAIRRIEAQTNAVRPVWPKR